MRISIDPGTSSIGWATWSDRSWKRVTAPLEVGTLTVRGLWTDRLRLLVPQIDELFSNRCVTEAFIEKPTYMASGKGAVAASSDALSKLCFGAGAIAAVAHLAGVKVHWVEVADWKGQLPKGVVVQRIKSRLPSMREITANEHEWDAVGIGLYAKGHF